MPSQPNAREFMSDEFYLSRKSYHVLELAEDTKSDDKLDGETLTEQSGRLIGKALGNAYVILDNQPLEAVGSVPMSEDEMLKFNEKLAPLIDKSIARLRERIARANQADQDNSPELSK